MTGVTKQQILIALEVDGEGVVRSLADALERNREVLLGYARAMADGKITAAEFVESTQKVAREQQQLGESLKFARQEMGRTQQAGRDLGYGILQASQAFDDLQYGIRGVLNNIPGLVVGFGGGAGLAGVLQILAVGIDALVRKLGALAGDPGLGRFADEVERIKANVESLEKQRKLGLNFEGLDEARRKLDEMERRVAALGKIGDRTSVQEESGRAVTEALTEAGGADAVADAIADVQRRQGTFFGRSKDFEKWRDVKAQRERIERTMGAPGMDPDAAAQLARDAARLEGEQRALEGGMTREGMDRIKRDMLGGAASGIESQRKAMFDMFMGNRDVFKAHGLGDALGAGLMAGDPEVIKAQRENARSVAEQERQAKERRDAERRRQDDENKRVDMLNQEGRAAEADIDRRLRDEKDEERERKRAADRQQRETTEREREVKGLAGRFGPGMTDDVQEALLRHVAGGQTFQRAFGSLVPQLTRRLQAEGLGDMSTEVAGRIFSEAQDRVRNRLAEAGGVTPSVARNLLGVDANRDQDAAARIAHREMLGGLQAQFQAGGFGAASEGLAKRTVSLMEHGVDQGSAMATAINELQSRLNRIEAQLRQNAAKLNSARQRRGTLLNNFPAGRD